ncbi:MAG: guanylate kinase [Clostridiaceae bacterium BRH_c20a]|nr:MAG: guanylate kinase [Clostridiaceae bacterium BRH_c20a]
MANKEGILLVLSGPSGAGKGTICKSLLREAEIQYSISATTRSPRTGEKDGREYFFLTKEDFENKIKEDALLEWAKVYDNYYGTPKKFVEDMLLDGKDCILEIDPQGAHKVRTNKPDGVLVFIAPPSMHELENRITNRGTENLLEIEKRLSCAKEEMLCMHNYDYVVINDQVEVATEKIKAILVAEKCRVQRNKACYL